LDATLIGRDLKLARIAPWVRFGSRAAAEAEPRRSSASSASSEGR
jgi:hypothetical protein